MSIGISCRTGKCGESRASALGLVASRQLRDAQDAGKLRRPTRGRCRSDHRRKRRHAHPLHLCRRDGAASASAMPRRSGRTGGHGRSRPRAEAGEGVARDDVRAAVLYENAAQDRPAFNSIYSPPVRLGGSGQVMMIPNADGGPGDAEAKYRLGQMLVEERGIGQDVARGQKLIEAARQQGYTPS